ncbi:MAG: LptF/LptG family permease [Bacteroidota bacterium]|nr:LptF/LptG family permease [Bacteroidota bacterium]
MKKLDLYIIKKFLGTFFFSISLILVIVIVFDISEKIDDFLESEAPLEAIVFDYYLNFIPFFANLFSPLFIFIAVIFFTSKMANNTEVIAILNSGMSFWRLLLPFMITAIFLASASFVLGNFVIPPANKNRIDFENKYIKNKFHFKGKDIHLQLQKGQYVYMESYNSRKDIAYKFALENIKDGKLQSKLNANYIMWDSTSGRWQINKWQIREFLDEGEKLSKGDRLDTLINLKPTDFKTRLSKVEAMNYFELNDYIKAEEIKGTANIVYHKIEKQKRMAFPFASIILTIIGVAVASRKIRGGTGLHLGAGLLISFSYILFMQISTTYATNGNLSAALAVWIPNIIYTILGGILVMKAPS